MNLQELAPIVDSNGVASQLTKQFEKEYRVADLGLNECKRLHNRTLEAISKYKMTNGIFESEKDPRYIKLLMMRDATAKRVAELSENIQEPNMKTSYVKALKHVAKGGKLSEAQIKRLRVSEGLKRVLENKQTALAFIKRIVENKQGNGRQLNESEIDSAQVVLAAQDIADQVQTMIEKFADIQYKELPALKDGIRKEMGVETAESFDSSVQSSIQELTSSLESTKNELSNAVAMLTGDEPVGDGDLDMDALGDEGDMDMDMDADMDMGDELGGEEELDMDLDLDMGDDEEVDLGREKR